MNAFKKINPVPYLTKSILAVFILVTLSACIPARSSSPPLLSAPQSALPPPPPQEEIVQVTPRPAASVITNPPAITPEEPLPPPTPEAISPVTVTTPPQPDYYESSASYYAKRFKGRRTASGERYDPELLTAATRDFPLQSWLKVINPANGREVVVRVNDRTGKRKTPLVDLSRAAAKELDFLGKGKIRVHIVLLPPPT